MKQQLFLFSLLLAIPTLMIGQLKFDYEVSKPYKVIDAPIKSYFSAENNTKTLSVKIRGKDIYMQSFDTKTMKEVKRNVFSDMPKGFVIEDLMWLGDHVYCFFSLWDRSQNKEQLFVREIDFEGCKFKNKPKKLIAIDGKLTGSPLMYVGFFSFGAVNKFSFLKSHDESKLLVQCRKVPEKRRDAVNYDKIGMYVFNVELEKMGGGEVKMPYTEKQMDNIDYHLNSEGTPYILAKVREDNTTRDTKGRGKNKTANYHIELLKVNLEDKRILATKIAVKDRFIKDIWLYDGPDNTMYCSGFYNGSVDKPFVYISDNQVNDDNADGIFLLKIDKEGDILSHNFYEIPIEVLNQYTRNTNQKRNERKEKKGKAEFASLELRKLNVQEDGSVIITGEQYYIVVYHDSKGRPRYTYHYNDMLATKISPDGKMEWMRKLPKRQFGSRGRGGMSFRQMKIGDAHYFVFLDNVKNMKLGLDQRPAVHADGRGGYLTAYKVDDETGKVDKVSIFNTLEVDGDYKVYQFNTGRILRIGDEQFAVEFYKKGKEDLMIKVNVK